MRTSTSTPGSATAVRRVSNFWLNTAVTVVALGLTAGFRVFDLTARKAAAKV
ncbi:hypothetical protein QFZ23_001310 [Arthrobacter globiformis]|nr:hypothetical protein [Arthrobacter globiformis]